MRSRSGSALVALLLAFFVRWPAFAEERAPLCDGDYADELALLSSRDRDLERDKKNRYSYCLRTTAVYECLSYAPDGTVRRARKTAVAHGTAFAYKRAGGDTYLLTNDHVASWPAVTDDEHKVDDVPTGCKMISEALRIVDDEADDYEANDVVLQRVMSDPALDMAVLKTRAPLTLIPYKIGRSSALHVGNLVAVRGFPLGAFAALNLGKVVNTYDYDTSRDWDHVDFVVDALLSPGNSGSPVLAISCKTGEYELVGVYHAGYVNGSALNVVVGVDQLADLMNLKRPKRLADNPGFGPAQREALAVALASPGASPFFPLGPLVAAVRPGERGALWFEVYSRGFPLDDERVLVVEDLAGEPARLYFGNRRGLKATSLASLDPDGQAQVQRVLQRLHAGALLALRYRTINPSSRQAAHRLRAIERTRDQKLALDRDVAQSLLDLADRFAPKPGEPAVSYTAAVSPVQVRELSGAKAPTGPCDGHNLSAACVTKARPRRAPARR